MGAAEGQRTVNIARGGSATVDDLGEIDAEHPAAAHAHVSLIVDVRNVRRARAGNREEVSSITGVKSNLST